MCCSDLFIKSKLLLLFCMFFNVYQLLPIKDLRIRFSNCCGKQLQGCKISCGFTINADQVINVCYYLVH